MMQVDVSTIKIESFMDELRDFRSSIGNEQSKATSAYDNTYDRVKEAIEICEDAMSVIDSDRDEAERTLKHDYEVLKALQEAEVKQKAFIAECESVVAHAEVLVKKAAAAEAALKEPSSTGNSEADAAAKKSYESQKKALHQQYLNAKKSAENARERVVAEKKNLQIIQQNIVTAKNAISTLESMKRDLERLYSQYSSNVSNLRMSLTSLERVYKNFITEIGRVENVISDVISKSENARKCIDTATRLLNIDDRRYSGKICMNNISYLSSFYKNYYDSVRKIIDTDNAISSQASYFSGIFNSEISRNSTLIVQEISEVTRKYVEFADDTLNSIKGAYSALANYVNISVG